MTCQIKDTAKYPLCLQQTVVSGLLRRTLQKGCSHIKTISPQLESKFPLPSKSVFWSF